MRIEENSLSHSVISILFTVPISFLIKGRIRSTKPPRKRIALIIVSTYNGNEREILKGAEFREKLIRNGYSPPNIIFLADVDTKGSDGVSRKSNVERAFQHLSSLSSDDTDVVIYISDHITPLQNSFHFQFADGTIPVDSVCDWIDDVNHKKMTIIPLGIRSDVLAEKVQSASRTIIDSLGPGKTLALDNFISFTYNDNRISFVEACENEKSLLIREEKNPI